MPRYTSAPCRSGKPRMSARPGLTPADRYNRAMSQPPFVLRVALPLPLPQCFDYLPPDGHLPSVDDVGRRVQVTFGRREEVGMVVDIGTSQAHGQLRPVQAFLDERPLVDGELWQSLHWLAAYLHAPLGEVLATALPSLLRHGQPLPETHRHGWQLTENGQLQYPTLRKGRPRALAELLAGGLCDEAQLDARLPNWRAAMRRLQARALVERRRLPEGRAEPMTDTRGISLNDEQQQAVAAIVDSQGFAPFLLDGVTGSGKTEVYLEAIAACLARGRQALVLVPEIGLTPQTLTRFQRRLGVPIHALHSGLSDGERAKVWAAARSGQARVIVGTRSAVFVPLPEPGILIVDEEHDGSYKQLDGIRYHARDFALVRGKALQIPVVLGSATPALETLHNAQSGRFAHLRLRKRAGTAMPPEVRVVDIRKCALDAGLAASTLTAMEEALDAGGQVLVFKNRRGYAPLLLCHDCGWQAQCPHCGSDERPSPMTVHQHGRRLQCHHCGQHRRIPPACPDCGSLALQPQGNGTERIEEFLGERFKSLPVIRIDRGNTRGRDALAGHLARLGNQPGILIGTQMLAKGHDLPNLTLVVVVGIDEGLYSVDFRASERLAQLLVQVAGRAGRAEKPGRVLLQTHHPEHPLLITLIRGGYHAFAEAELAIRKAAGWPPFTHLALLRAEARETEAPMHFLQEAARHASETFSSRAADVSQQLGGSTLPPLQIYNPTPAPHPRRAGYQRAQLLLGSAQRVLLHRTLTQLMPALYPAGKRLRWSLDVDPQDLY